MGLSLQYTITIVTPYMIFFLYLLLNTYFLDTDMYKSHHTTLVRKLGLTVTCQISAIQRNKCVSLVI